MPNESGLLRRMRETLRGSLPERAFLKRDRGDALFITNAPAFTPEAPSIPGFILFAEGSLLRILPDAGWIAGLEEAFPEPPDDLCRSLLRFRDADPDAEGLRLFAQGLKLLDTGPSALPVEIAAFDKALRQSAALALRNAIPGGGLYAAAVIRHQIAKEYES